MKIRSRIRRRACVVAALSIVVPALIAAADDAARTESVWALPDGFPVPEGARLVRKARSAVRIGVEGADLFELERFLREKLQADDYRIIRRTTDQDEETLLPGEDYGINLTITAPGRRMLVDSQGLYIRQAGREVWFELTTELMECVEDGSIRLVRSRSMTKQAERYETIAGAPPTVAHCRCERPM